MYKNTRDGVAIPVGKIKGKKRHAQRAIVLIRISFFFSRSFSTVVA